MLKVIFLVLCVSAIPSTNLFRIRDDSSAESDSFDSLEQRKSSRGLKADPPFLHFEEGFLQQHHQEPLEPRAQGGLPVRRFISNNRESALEEGEQHLGAHGLTEDDLKVDGDHLKANGDDVFDLHDEIFDNDIAEKHHGSELDNLDDSPVHSDGRENTSPAYMELLDQLVHDFAGHTYSVILDGGATEVKKEDGQNVEGLIADNVTDTELVRLLHHVGSIVYRRMLKHIAQGLQQFNMSDTLDAGVTSHATENRTESHHPEANATEAKGSESRPASIKEVINDTSTKAPIHTSPATTANRSKNEAIPFDVPHK